MDMQEMEEHIGYWRDNERTFMRLFFVMFAVFVILQVILDFLVWEIFELSFWVFVLGIFRSLIFAYAITSFILGIVFVWRFKGEGIVPIRDILKTMGQVALVVALFFTLLFAADLSGVLETGLYDASDGNGPEITAARGLAMAVGFFALTFGGTLLAMLAVLVGGFGIIGMIFVFLVGGTPKLIEKLEGITRKEDTESKLIMWFFGIPAALDTDVLLVDEPAPETRFPWTRFRTAVLWQVAFGIILAIYVSLNPWLLREFSMGELFRFMSSAFVVLPFLVLPWFIHMRLSARYKGVSKDFYFYKAFKDRFTGLIIASGTLMIFLKFAYETSSIEEILAAFSSYIFIMVLCIIAFTFIYFNFFENPLAKEAYLRYVEAKEGKVDTEEAAEGSQGEDGEEESSEQGS